MQIINGKALAQTITDEIKTEIECLHLTPGLGIILVGENPSSEHYVELKKKRAEKLGFYAQIIKLPNQTTQIELEAEINKLNNNPVIHGIIVQLPLPAHLDANTAISAINPNKDADGLHPLNIGNLANGILTRTPATPAGIIRLLEHARVKIEGAQATIVGRSNIVGKPVALMLMAKNATITICHSKTQNLTEHTRHADILVVAVGKPGLITAEMIKEGACVIDVGSTLVNGQWLGDVDHQNLEQKPGWITPVPGGVGPMTVAMLLKNTLELAKNYELNGFPSFPRRG